MTITLETLSQATAQEVLDQVATHLLAQGKRSESYEFNCRYRGDDGLKCAAGCLIGSGEYKPEMEGNDWTGLVEDFRVPADHCDLICELQAVHDHFKPKDWRIALRNVAVKFGLEFRS